MYPLVYSLGMFKMAATSKSAKNFAANVRTCLQGMDISIDQLAVELKMSRPGLSRLLNGHQDLTFRRGEKIAAYFGYDLPDFLKPLRKFRKTA
jgi:transcriptional regulator with XRE-family HTH domain